MGPPPARPRAVTKPKRAAAAKCLQDFRDLPECSDNTQSSSLVSAGFRGTEVQASSSCGGGSSCSTDMTAPGAQWLNVKVDGRSRLIQVAPGLYRCTEQKQLVQGPGPYSNRHLEVVHLPGKFLAQAFKVQLAHDLPLRLQVKVPVGVAGAAGAAAAAAGVAGFCAPSEGSARATALIVAAAAAVSTEDLCAGGSGAVAAAAHGHGASSAAQPHVYDGEGGLGTAGTVVKLDMGCTPVWGPGGSPDRLPTGLKVSLDDARKLQAYVRWHIAYLELVRRGPQLSTYIETFSGNVLFLECLK